LFPTRPTFLIKPHETTARWQRILQGLEVGDDSVSAATMVRPPGGTRGRRSTILLERQATARPEKPDEGQ